ncbi:hypothetical protein Tco_1237832, partial [Tanacetum coccineum]
MWMVRPELRVLGHDHNLGLIDRYFPDPPSEDALIEIATGYLKQAFEDLMQAIKSVKTCSISVVNASSDWKKFNNCLVKIHKLIVDQCELNKIIVDVFKEVKGLKWKIRFLEEVINVSIVETFVSRLRQVRQSLCLVKAMVESPVMQPLAVVGKLIHVAERPFSEYFTDLFTLFPSRCYDPAILLMCESLTRCPITSGRRMWQLAPSCAQWFFL